MPSNRQVCMKLGYRANRFRCEREEEGGESEKKDSYCAETGAFEIHDDILMFAARKLLTCTLV